MRYIRAIGFVSILAFTMSHAASFDCKKAVSEIEKMICDDKELNALDTKMGKLYRQAKHIPGVKDEQKNWVDRRNRMCGSSYGCLLGETKDRIAALKKVLHSKGSTAHRAYKKGSTSAHQKAHAGNVFSPDRGIICDKKSGLCMDGTGISVEFTKEYLGRSAAEKLMKRIEKFKNYDTTWVTFSNGLDCRAKEKVCYTGKHTGVVDKHWTAILFAY